MPVRPEQLIQTNQLERLRQAGSQLLGKLGETLPPSFQQGGDWAEELLWYLNDLFNPDYLATHPNEILMIAAISGIFQTGIFELADVLEQILRNRPSARELSGHLGRVLTNTAVTAAREIPPIAIGIGLCAWGNLLQEQGVSLWGSGIDLVGRAVFYWGLIPDKVARTIKSSVIQIINALIGTTLSMTHISPDIENQDSGGGYY